MIVVGAMAAVIWIAGAVLGSPRQARLLMLGILLTAVLALHVVLPDGHPLREATGSDPRLWLLLVVAVAGAWAYTQLLGRVRAEAHRRQAPPAPPPPVPGTFSEAELSRYARHITLREIGGPGQRRLQRRPTGSRTQGLASWVHSSQLRVPRMTRLVEHFTESRDDTLRTGLT